MTNTCIFTIVSRNYLHYARTLLNSIKEHHDDIDFYIGLCDSPDGVDIPEKEFKILPLANINLPDWDNFVFRYTILELNTAIKPFVISDMLDKGYQKVIYFDPDIYVYRSLESMLGRLEENDILLTPHLTGLLDDDKMPDELTIMRSGVYNLGYIGLRNTENTKSFINWWKDKLTYECVVDIEAGLFVDQKWVDLVPSIFDKVYIERNEGWNVAYWNLKHRQIERSGESYLVNGEPLTFFHYSGFNVEAKTLSKHQNRFSKKSAGPAVNELCKSYGDKLLSHDVKIYQKIAYHFGSLVGGIAIPDMARYIFREEIENRGEPEMKLYSEAGADWIIEQLNTPSAMGSDPKPWITRLSKRLYDAREDLQYAFPNLSGIDGVRFGEWFVGSAGEQANIGARFTDPVVAALAALRADQGKETNDVTGPGSKPVPNAVALNTTPAAPVKIGFAKRVYDFAWRKRHIGRFIVPQLYRKKLHAILLARVYPKAAKGSAPAKDTPTAIEQDSQKSIPIAPIGLNVIGYLNAESGIGESVRSSIKALNTTEIPLSLSDFRVGNISRMDAEVDTAVINELSHSINLFHINADQIPVVREYMGDDAFRGRYNIGYWAWELPEFPDEWLSALDYLDEIWVPSSFCQRAIAQKSTKPVLVFPHAISINSTTPSEPLPIQLSKGSYKFLFMFDALSIPERKNPFAILDAYKTAQSLCTENMELVIKVSNLDKTTDFKVQFSKICKNDKTIRVIDIYLSRGQLDTLQQATDCFISLHRSEGFGLGIAEAMAHGKPVIATNWSGSTDFIDSDSALPIPYKLIQLSEDLGPYKAGQSWAEPDINAASERMAWLASHPAEGKQLGEVARQAITAYCAPEVVGESMGRRIQTIYQSSFW